MAIQTRSSPSNPTIDRLARQALREKAGVPDLLAEGVPFRPSLWHIVIEPLTPRTTSDGGIEVVDISVNAEEHQITVGRVLSCGPAAFEGKTTSGIELKHFLPGIDSPEQLIGKFVIYQQHTGHTLKLRRTGQTVKVMRITDLLGDTSDPDAWKFYI